MFTAVAHKRPWSFCQKCKWQVTPKHMYTLDPMKTVWLSRCSVGIYSETSSCATCWGTFSHSCLRLLTLIHGCTSPSAFTIFFLILRFELQVFFVIFFFREIDHSSFQTVLAFLTIKSASLCNDQYWAGRVSTCDKNATVILLDTINRLLHKQN